MEKIDLVNLVLEILGKIATHGILGNLGLSIFPVTVLNGCV